MTKARPPISELRAWVKEHTGSDTPHRIVAVGDYLEEHGLALDQLEVVVNADPSWPSRRDDGRAQSAEQVRFAARVASSTKGTTTRVWWIVPTASAARRLAKEAA